MEISPWDNAMAQLDKAADFLNLNKDILVILKNCERINIVNLPIRRDNGKIECFTGIRVLHSSARGPTKGGVRFHPQVTLDEVKALAFWMSMKTSVVGLPYGGAKGGIICNPQELSINEIERLTRRYTSMIGTFSPWRDIPAPDVNTNSQIMAWIMDTYSMNVGETSLGVVTGKPIDIGGSLGRETATGQGMLYIMEEFCKKTKQKLDSSTTIAIQGFGNVGSAIARFLYERHNCKIVAVSDEKGGVYNPDGMDMIELKNHEQKTGSVVEFDGTTFISNEDLLRLKCDFLLPCALENQINDKIAETTEAKTIIEGANGPTLSSADKILEERDIIVVPDILANAGGVTCSYFEWVQDLHSFFWDLDRVNHELKRILAHAFDDVYKMYEKEKTDFRNAAYLVGIARIARAIELRGIYP
ncbi:MAG: Glu/Leu/Phe/Val family dehydrogenase [Candidatus Helarchaeota archaeon]